MMASVTMDASAHRFPVSAPTGSHATRHDRSIMIIGPTGSGKSRLAIEIAAALGGEVVNADVVQMYSGLDVASAKVPLAERQGVPHHLMSFLPPRAAFDVRSFRKLALAIEADIHARRRVPVVAGGTLYYLQSLLRESLLEEDEAAVGPHDLEADVTDSGSIAPSTAPTINLDARMACNSHEVAYDRLRRVDAVMAERLHPNDSRKIARALAVFDATGVPYSEVIRRQSTRLQRQQQNASRSGLSLTDQADADGNDTVGGRRGSNSDVQQAGVCAQGVEAGRTAENIAGADASASPSRFLVINLSVADRAVLNSRLDRRVESMVAAGLVHEVRELWEKLREMDAELLQTNLPSASGESAGEALSKSSRQQPPQRATGDFSCTIDIPSELTLRLASEYSHFVATNSAAHAAATSNVPQNTPAPSCDHCTMISMKADAQLCESSVSTPTAHVDTQHVRRYDGVLQAIGFKEFASYFASLSAPISPPAPLATRRAVNVPTQRTTLDPGLSGIDAAEAALTASIASVRSATHRYARRQEHWIRNRFVRRGLRMITLDTSGVDASAAKWGTTVFKPALAASRAWLSDTDAIRAAEFAAAAALEEERAVGRMASTSGLASALGRVPEVTTATATATSNVDATAASPLPDDATRLFQWRKHTCASCDRVLNGDAEWEAHLSSRGHARAVAAERKRLQLFTERGILLPKGKRGRPRTDATRSQSDATSDRTVCDDDATYEQSTTQLTHTDKPETT